MYRLSSILPVQVQETLVTLKYWGKPAEEKRE